MTRSRDGGRLSAVVERATIDPGRPSIGPAPGGPDRSDPGGHGTTRPPGSRRALVVAGLGVVLCLLAIGAPAAAAEDPFRVNTSLNDTDIDGVYGGEPVEYPQRINDLVRTSDGGLMALRADFNGSAETTVVRLNATGAVRSEVTVPGELRAVSRVGEESYAAAGLRGNDTLVTWIHANGSVAWSETGGGDGLDAATDVVSAPDGDAYVLLSTESGTNTSELGVVRVSADREVVWERVVEHETWTAFPKGERLPDGSLIATIRTKRSMDKRVDGRQNVSVVRIEPNGTVSWRTVVVGTGDPIGKEEMFDVVPAHGPGVLLAGATSSGNADGSFDFWAARIAPDGDLLAQQQYDLSPRDFASGVVRTDGGYLLVGFSERANGTDTRASFLGIGREGAERFRATYSLAGNATNIARAADWTSNGRLAVGGTTFDRDADPPRAVGWILDFTEAFPQLEPFPSVWETQHRETDYGIANLSLAPDTVESNATVEHDLRYTVTGASSDGSTDDYAITVPAALQFEGAALTVTDAGGEEIPLAANVSVIDAGNGTDNRITFAIAPDDSVDTSELTVEASVAIAYPETSIERTTGIRVDVADSTAGRTFATTQITVEPRRQEIVNLSLDPETAESNTTVEHDLRYTVAGASTDASEHAFTVPPVLHVENASVEVTDAGGEEIPLAANVSVIDAGNGTDNRVIFGFQPDDGVDTSELTVEARVAIAYPETSIERTTGIRVDVADSAGNRDNATTAITVEPPVPADAVYDPGSPPARFDADGDGRIALEEFAAAATAYAQGELDLTQLSRVATAYAVS